MAIYFAIVSKERDGGEYLIRFLDFPDEEIREKDWDKFYPATEHRLIKLLEENPIEHPKTYKDALIFLYNARMVVPNSFIQIFRIYPKNRKSQRINITMDASLLESIDKVAAANGMSRSRFLAEAAKDRISASLT